MGSNPGYLLKYFLLYLKHQTIDIVMAALAITMSRRPQCPQRQKMATAVVTPGDVAATVLYCSELYKMNIFKNFL